MPIFKIYEIENKVFQSFHNLYGSYMTLDTLYKERKKLLKKYKRYMFDEFQTIQTRNQLSEERQNNYELKLEILYLNMLHQETIRNFDSIKGKDRLSKELRRLNIQKKNHKLNSLLIKRLKQQYLKVISPLLLPHDLENLIISYLV